jgi:cellulose synthase/poly-beta-1,6-N-acetylglucosamine synthase-like glycosyltransferase
MIYLVTLAFWLSVLLVVYPYLIYPPLLLLLARFRPVRGEPQDAGGLPQVTLVISAYNEEAVIAEKLRNALNLDYPPESLEVTVVSDASSDRTDDIVQEVSAREPRVRLVRLSERRGKSAGLNRAVEVAQGDIVVFSDANALYEPRSIRELVRGFADPQVGYVVGAALYYDAKGNRAAESEGLYWKLEMFLKHLESEYHSVVGGDGAIYAIRRHLFRELKDDDISDFVNPLQIVASGFRGLFNAKARCFEGSGETFGKEFKRKRRIVNRTWRAVRRYGGLLKLRDHGRFVFMLVSHKVIRWFTLPFVIVAWVANIALLGTSSVYILTWVAITGSVVVAGFGAILVRLGLLQPRLVSILYYFYLVSLAGLLGIWDEWRGVRHAIWDHIRKSEA